MSSTANVFTELAAAGPHPEHHAAVMQFGRFVGVWDMTVQFIDPHGDVVFDGVGRWEFTWILDGLGVQDVLVYALPDRFSEPRGNRGIGTTVRAYLPAERRWRQVWAAPRAGNFIVMESESTVGDIRITGLDMDGSHLEWAFTDITADSFTWTGRTSTDGVSNWRVEQRMHGRRRRIPEPGA